MTLLPKISVFLFFCISSVHFFCGTHRVVFEEVLFGIASILALSAAYLCQHAMQSEIASLHLQKQQVQKEMERQSLASMSIVTGDAKYLQLREQFENKSVVLDTTRKELFLVSEERDILRKKLFEIESQPVSEQEKHLMKLIDESQVELEKSKQEIASYETLICELLEKVPLS